MLFERNRLTNQVRGDIDALQDEIDAMVYRSSEQATHRIDQIGTVVHVFNLITALTALFMIHHVWARLRSEDVLAHQAIHDPLTGLPHRRSLAKARARNTSPPSPICARNWPGRSASTATRSS